MPVVKYLPTYTHYIALLKMGSLEGYSIYSPRVLHYSPNFCVERKVSNLSTI